MALLSAIVSCKKCILASCGVLEEESSPGLLYCGYHGGRGRSMGIIPHLGVGNFHFLPWRLSADFVLVDRTWLGWESVLKAEHVRAEERIRPYSL
jgi:hypothetical protein